MCTIALRAAELTQVTQADVHFGRKKFLKSDHPLAYFGGDEVTVPSIRSFRVTLGRPRPRRLFRLGSFVFDRVFTFEAGTVGNSGATRGSARQNQAFDPARCAAACAE